MHDILLQTLTQHVPLRSEEQKLVTSFFEARAVKKKGYILRAGETLRSATFVANGCFKMYSLDEAGKEHVTRIAMEGWWVGDIESFLTQKPSSYFVQALEHGTVLQVSKDNMETLYRIVPAVERYFRIVVQKAYIAFQSRIVASMSKPAAERYRDFCAMHPGIEQRVPLHTIASYLGVTPEFLSRIRKSSATP